MQINFPEKCSILKNFCFGTNLPKIHSWWLFYILKTFKTIKTVFWHFVCANFTQRKRSFLRCDLITPNNLQCCRNFELGPLHFLHDLSSIPDSKCYFWLQGVMQTPKMQKHQNRFFLRCDLITPEVRYAKWLTPIFDQNELWAGLGFLCWSIFFICIENREFFNYLHNSWNFK